ncbi:MAG TPA: MoxR family ATPase [Methanosarcinales archaeon]|nr:MoxR family ATPase [Methanosarcinales archaeon]
MQILLAICPHIEAYMTELVVFGQDEMKHYLRLFAEAIKLGLRFNLLIEGPPGTAKTLAVNQMVASLRADVGDVAYVRVTGSQDALPSDLIGDLDIGKYREGETDILAGPLFRAHGSSMPGIVYADELNRFSEYTLIIFTEIMAEWQVSFPKTPLTKPLRANVIATMNPYDISGITDVPQHILDRFNARIVVNYPDREAELRIIAQHADYYYKNLASLLKKLFSPLVSTTRAMRKLGVHLGPRIYLSTLDLLALELSSNESIDNETVIRHYENAIRSRIGNLDEDKQSEFLSTASIALRGELTGSKR